MSAYYVALNGSEKKGPFSLDELREMQPASDTLVWASGMSDWRRICDVPELATLVHGPVVGGAIVTEGAANAHTPRTSPPGAADDFVICNPRLPRMGQLLSVYAILTNPAIWLANTLSTVLFAHLEDRSRSHLAMFAADVLWAILSLDFMVIMFIGGLKLRSLRRSGRSLIIFSICAGLVVGALFCTVAFIIGWNLESGPTRAPDIGDAVNLLIGVVILMAIGFEIVFLIWLLRSRHRLPLV